jgi:hypothetical protein
VRNVSWHAREDSLISRRDALCGGGAGVLTAVIAALLGDTKPVRAEMISGSVPEIDALSVRVVVDSYQFAVAPGRTLQGLEIQHFGWGIHADSPPRRTLVSEFVLLTSCSHRGVVNAIKQAQAASGTEKVHALIGGFHLAPYQDEYVQQTVDALKEINIDYVIPLHRTGEPFYDKARAAMSAKVLRSYTGTRFVFS